MAERTESVAGIALASAAGFGFGLLAGLIAGEWLGGVDAERVRKAVDRFRPESGGAGDRTVLEAAVRQALRSEPATRYLKVRVRALGDRLVVVTGRVGNEVARERTGEVARAAAPGCTVINRLLVEGEDLPRGSRGAAPAQ
jgi:hypothetical protein